MPLLSDETFHGLLTTFNPHIRRIDFFPNKHRKWQSMSSIASMGRSHVTKSKTDAYCAIGASPDNVVVFCGLSGHADARCGNLRYEIAPGQVVALPSDETHTTSSAGWHRMALVAPRQDLLAAARTLGHDVDRHKLDAGASATEGTQLALFKRNLSYFVDLCENDFNKLPNFSRHLGLFREMILYSLVPALFEARNAPEAAARFKPPSLDRAIDFIETHFTKSICLSDIAAAAGCSVRYLQSAFKRHLGTTAVQEIRKRRLACARRLLVSAGSAETVTNVALASGFAHLSDFANAYRTEFGELPSHTLHRALRG